MYLMPERMKLIRCHKNTRSLFGAVCFLWAVFSIILDLRSLKWRIINGKMNAYADSSVNAKEACRR